MRAFLCFVLLTLAISAPGIAQTQAPAKKQPATPETRKAMPERQTPGSMSCPCDHMMGPGMGMMGPGMGMMGPGPGMMGPGMMGPGPGMMGQGMTGPGMGMMQPGMDGRNRMFVYRRGGPGPGSGPQFGRWRHGMSGPGEHMFAERLGRELNLSDAQVNRLHQMKVDQQKKAIRERADLETKELELNELLRSPNPDRAAIDAKIGEIGALRTQVMKDHIDSRLAFEQVLTPEQKQKMRQGREGRQRPGPGQQRPGMRGRPAAPPQKPAAPQGE